VKTTIFVCPFAQFGNPGTMAGAQLVADALRELLEDNREEERPHRARAYSAAVTIEELPLATPTDYQKWHQKAREAARRALDAGNFLIWIGGNHLSVLPLYEEVGARKGSLVVQLDAHLDLYHLRDCVPELSHGNFLRQLNPAPAIINVGHRDLFLAADEIAKHFADTYGIVEFLSNEAKVLKAVSKAAKVADGLIVDLDVDALDPAYFPATVDAMPFGLTPQQLLKVFDAAWSDKLVGLSISEFDPGRDKGDRSMELLVWLIEYVLLRRYE